jgi:hypothetical protein
MLAGPSAIREPAISALMDVMFVLMGMMFVVMGMMFVVMGMTVGMMRVAVARMFRFRRGCVRTWIYVCHSRVDVELHPGYPSTGLPFEMQMVIAQVQFCELPLEG